MGVDYQKGPRYHNQQTGGFRVVKGPRYHNQSNNVNQQCGSSCQTINQQGGFRVVKGPRYHNQTNNVNQHGGASCKTRNQQGGSQWGKFLPVSQGVVHKDDCLMMGPNIYPRHLNQKGGKRKTKGKRKQTKRRTRKRSQKRKY